jgi:hypothetical protein
LLADFRIARSDAATQRIEDEGFDVVESADRSGKQYRLRLDQEDFAQRGEFLRELVRLAHSDSES